MSRFAGLAAEMKGKCIEGAKMAEHTTWKIGGPADCLALPACKEDIIACCRWAAAASLPLTVLGNGSNLLVLDGGIRGLVMKIGEAMASYRVEGERILAEPGILLAKLAREASKLGLAGLSWAAGIPASLGGAAIMNAGAFDHHFYEVLESVSVIDENLEERFIGKDGLEYGYRHTALQERPLIVTEIVLRMAKAEPAALLSIVEEKLAYRREKQPLEYPSCGSVFKNPPGDHAGRLIEAAGLRGFGIGNAAVSQKHGNFIINPGGATAADALAVIAHVQKTVEKEFGVSLEPEVKIIGEPKEKQQ